MPEKEFWLSQTSFNTRNYSSLSALLFLILDYLSTCKWEYQYIWCARSMTVKVLYLFARYLALIIQSAHYALIHKFLANGPVSLKSCRAWFILLYISCGTMVAVLDAILFLRVFALYKKNRNVYWLSIPILLQFIAAAFVLKRTALQENPFNSKCDITETPIEAAILGVAVVFAHAALFITSFLKRSATQGQVVVVNLVVKEGAWTFVLLFGLVLGLQAFAFTSRSSNPFVLFVWPIAVISVTSCRMIMGMRRLQMERSSDSIPRNTAEDTLRLTLTIIRTSLDSHEALEQHHQRSCHSGQVS